VTNAPATDFQKICSNQIACLKRECKDAIEQHPDTGGVMERVHIALIDIGRIPEYAPVNFGEGPQWIEFVIKAAKTSTNLQLCNTLVTFRQFTHITRNRSVGLIRTSRLETETIPLSPSCHLRNIAQMFYY
jgi:hypothetical protein